MRFLSLAGLSSLALTLAAMLSGCSSSEVPAGSRRPKEIVHPAVAVETATVSIQQCPDVYEATGTVRARTITVLSSKVMAYVRAVSVEVGDRVGEGRVLVTLESSDLDANLRRAEAVESEVRSAFLEADNAVAGAKANLDLAQSTFRRMEELASKKSISNQEFDEASAHLRAAQAAYDMARAKRAQLDSRLAQSEQEIRAAAITRNYAQITAPFSGVVTAKSVEPGNLAVPGASLLTIEQERSYRLETPVEESKLPFVKIGETVEIAVEALDRRLTARVSEIVPAVDAAARAYIVKIDLPAMSNLRSGMFGRAWFPLGVRKVLAIPPSALKERGQLQSVFVVEDGVAHTRLVTFGQHGPNGVEVLSGLSENERVVNPIPEDLTDGARVEVHP